MYPTLIESARGCGYRKPGGLYLVSGKVSAPCGRLPIPLTVCPTCHAGIHFSRGFTWVGRALIDTVNLCKFNGCDTCELNNLNREKYGLMWVGQKFYPEPKDFIREGMMQGVSKRISAVPNEFKLGEDWILLAHLKCIKLDYEVNGEPAYQAGIFTAFKPERIEYVLKGDETLEELQNLEKRGITPVNVMKDTEAQTTIV